MSEAGTDICTEGYVRSTVLPYEGGLRWVLIVQSFHNHDKYQIAQQVRNDMDWLYPLVGSTHPCLP